MLTKAQALYQVKLILSYLPEEEYRLIPEELIKEIEENYEYDKDIIINPKVPLDKQKLDDKAYHMLERIIKNIRKSNYNNKEETNKNSRNEVIQLQALVEILKKENEKIPKAKELVEKYKELLNDKDIEIANLKKKNQELYMIIQKVPRLFRKIFIKDDLEKLLN